MMRLLPFLVTLLARTLRFRWSGVKLPDRAIVMFWHGKMFAGWYAVRGRDARATQPIALVSASKDGQILSRVLSRWGYQLARGSTGKRGREALAEATDRLKLSEVNILAITPDGPRGPLHVFKRGAFIAANETGLPLFFLRVAYRSRIVLKKSWDGFEVPLPFSRVEIEVVPVAVPKSLDDEALTHLSRQFA